MSNNLDVLAKPENRQAILLGEVGAWLHLLGKFSQEFLQREHMENLKELCLPDDYLELLENVNDLAILKEQWLKPPFKVLCSVINGIQDNDLPDTLYLFSKFHRRRGKEAPGRQGTIARPTFAGLICDAHGRSSGTDKSVQPKSAFPQQVNDVRLSTGFGYESMPIITDKLNNKQQELYRDIKRQVDDLKNSGSPTFADVEKWFVFLKTFRRGLEVPFRQTVGDTRRPINDVSLWDQTVSAVAFFKAALAGLLLKGVWQDPLNKKTKPKWRILRVALDGEAYLSNALRIGDTLARVGLVTDLFNGLQRLLEVKYPLAHEIYRDESLALYIVPDIPGLLELENNQRKTLEGLIYGTVRTILQGEVKVEVLKGGKASRNVFFVGSILNRPVPNLTAEPGAVDVWWNNRLHDRCTVCQLRPQGYGADQVNQYRKNPDYYAQKAQRRSICCFCMDRLSGRSKTWTKSQLHQTIWVDEASDLNGRIALLVGRLNLVNWVNGLMTSSLTNVDTGSLPESNKTYCELVQELKSCHQNKSLDDLVCTKNLIKKAIRKDLKTVVEIEKFLIEEEDLGEQIFNTIGKREKLALALVRKAPSFTRVRRVWDTTRQFWQDILPTDEKSNITHSELARVLEQYGPRLQIRGTLSCKYKPGVTPAPYHAYELALGPTKLTAVWIPGQELEPDEGEFITADNLQYVTKQLPDKVDVTSWLSGKTVNVEETTSYGSATKTWGTITVDVNGVKVLSSYVPAIPILAEPQTFMALVPADKALQLVDTVRQKYEREMGKVRNRLPLHLGVVYADRRIPLRAVLEAGRGMLNVKGNDKPWRVAAKPSLKPEDDLPKEANYLTKDNKHFTEWLPVVLEQDGRQFTWIVPARMGDGNSPDNWYHYVFIEIHGNNDKVKGRRRRFKAMRPKGGDVAEPCWLVHAAELDEGDEIYFTPATFDFEWLDVAGRRFEIHYNKDGKRPGRPARPYLLDQVTDLNYLWKKMLGHRELGLTNSQINALMEIIERRRQEWGGDAGKDSTFKDLVRNALREIWGKEGWKKLVETYGDDKIKFLEHAATSGMLSDVVELYMQIMKQDSRKK